MNQGWGEVWAEGLESAKEGVIEFGAGIGWFKNKENITKEDLTF